MPQFLQDYDKLKFLGKGSFAKIYKVRHREYGYIRAIKVLDEEIGEEDDKVYKTFVKECSLLLRLGNGCHPNIVRIYQPRKIEDRALVEMDCIEGTTLEKFVSEKKFIDIKEVLKFVKEIGSALAYCHVDCYKYMMSAAEKTKKEEDLVQEYGVAHNDLHSNNIMRRDMDGSYVLLDFGLAIQDDKAVKSSSRRDGAAEYMAPEKWSGQHIENEKAVDIYGFGVLLYQMLAGRVPFVLDPQLFNTDSLRALNQIRKDHELSAPGPVLPLREAAFKAVNPAEEYVKDYPEWLEEMILRCLAKNPKDRFQNGKEMMAFFDEKMEESEDGKEKAYKESILLLETENKNLHEKNDILKKKDAGLSEQIKGLTAEKGELVGRIEKLTAENTGLSNRIDELNVADSNLKESIKKFEAELSKLKRRGDGGGKRAYKIWSWVASALLLLSLGYSVTRNDHDDYAGAAAEEAVEAVQAYDYESELDARNSEIRSLKESLSKKDDEIAGLTRQIENKDEEISSKNEEISTKDAEISSLKAADLTQRVATQNREIARLKAENKDLSDKNKTLSAQVDRFIQLMN